MTDPTYTDAYIRGLLANHRVFAMVGASAKETRPSFFVMKYLLAKGYQVIPVNPGIAGQTILDQQVYATLHDIPRPVDIVDIFRGADAALDITRDAISIGAKVVWLQLGVINEEAAKLAEDAGICVVMNRCPKIEYGRLSGEIGWMGVNSKTLSSKKPLLAAEKVQQRVIAKNTSYKS